MVKDSYPLTNIQEILHSLQGPTVFSSLDACGAYHAVRIEPGSQVCTAYVSLFGTVYTNAIEQDFISVQSPPNSAQSPPNSVQSPLNSAQSPPNSVQSPLNSACVKMYNPTSIADSKFS